MKIKKLQWSNLIKPNEDDEDDWDYPHIRAVTPIGVFYIDWKNKTPALECDEPGIYAISLDCPTPNDWGQWRHSCETVDEAKELAQEIFEKMVIGCLEDETNV